MESQLDKIGRNLKNDEHWTSTTIYRPSRRNQSELYLPEVHGNLIEFLVFTHAMK